VRCVGDAQRFLAEYWIQRPHLEERDGTDDFSDLLSLDHVDQILATMSLRYPAFRLVDQGRPLDRTAYTRSGTVGGVRINDLIDVGRVHDLFADGATIVLQGLHRFWPPVTAFCRELEVFLTQPLQANAYITPPVSSGLRVHHDTHDVFALQTHGRKHWVVHEPVIEQPLVTQRWSADEHDPGEAVLDVVLEPGDCLYVPRGTPHAARTLPDAASVHLTVGVRSHTWHDLLRLVLDEAAGEVAFREALPAGFAHDPEGLAPTVADRLKEAAAWLVEVDAATVAERMARRFWEGRIPPRDGQLRELLALDEVGDTTLVAPREGVHPRLRAAGDRLVIDLGDRRVEMPATVEPVVRQLLSADRTEVASLTQLDGESRGVLVRRLIREGVLVTVR
jgi:bifunctional lysine-specific demethylase and histidyl-hydroxylase NO66